MHRINSQWKSNNRNLLTYNSLNHCKNVYTFDEDTHDHVYIEDDAEQSEA